LTKQSGGLFTAKSYSFIDEIHRFSKSQQDSLLGAVEKGWITQLAPHRKPSFEVIPALLSRCQVYILNAFKRFRVFTGRHENRPLFVY
jgi:putative ATPase